MGKTTWRKKFLEGRFFLSDRAVSHGGQESAEEERQHITDPVRLSSSSGPSVLGRYFTLI